MHRAGRIIGWLVAATVTLLAAALLAVNLYVQSQGTQARIQQELSQRLDMPLRIQRISVTPWGGLKLSGITIPQTNPAGLAAFLKAKSFRLRVRLRSIFQQPLIIKEVALIQPQVTWAQNESGKWRVPSMTFERSSATPMKSAHTAGGTGPAAMSEPALHSAPLRDLPIAPPEIKRLKLTGGNFHFLDRQKQDVALFDEVEFSSAVGEASSLRGETRIARIALRNRVFLSDLRAALHYDPDQLKLSGIQAKAAKGELTGDFSMQPQAENSPFTVHATFDRVQADELVTQAGGAKGVMRGVLEGKLEAAGKLGDPAALTGTGAITLHGGHVQQFALLAAIGQVLQIEELTQLDLAEANAKYRLAGESVLLDELVLRSPNLRLNAGGTVSFDGKLALEAVLTINDKIRGQLPHAIRGNFVASEDAPGEYSLPFHIGGTLQKPKTNLMERAVGVDLKNIGGVIDALFGRGKSKKKNAEPAPDTNASAASPASATATPNQSPTLQLPILPSPSPSPIP